MLPPSFFFSERYKTYVGSGPGYVWGRKVCRYDQAKCFFREYLSQIIDLLEFFFVDDTDFFAIQFNYSF